MNILTEKLPDAVRVNGLEVGFRTDFRIWIEAGQLFRASEALDPRELTDRLRELVLESPAEDLSDEDLISAAALFYQGFPRTVGNSSARKEKVRKSPTYDFSADAAFVYSAFAACYGIRLAETRMHWFEFLTLFEGLMFGAENAMSFVVGVRQTEPGRVPKSEKPRMARLKREFALPKTRSAIEAEAAAALNRNLTANLGHEPNGREADHRD